MTEEYKHISGEAHPDNNPPVTIVAQASPEAAKVIEDQVNAERAAAEAEAAKKEEAADKTGEPKAATASVPEDLEDHTVPELKEIAAQKGISIPWDANKHDIIKAIKKAK